MFSHFWLQKQSLPHVHNTAHQKPCEMAPKHCWIHASIIEATGNGFQALADPLENGKNIFLDGWDGKYNESDKNTTAEVCFHDSSTLEENNNLLQQVLPGLEQYNDFYMITVDRKNISITVTMNDVVKHHACSISIMDERLDTLITDANSTQPDN